MKNNIFNIAVVSGGMIFWWLFNYIYHPVMLRYMSLADFWIFWSLMWVLNLIWVISVGIILFLNKEISKNINDLSKAKFIFKKSWKALFILSLFLFLLTSILSPLIANYLKIEQIWYIIIINASIFISLLSACTMAILRWLKKFEYIWVFQAISPIIKLILWVLFVYLWHNIYGAIWWVILSWCIWLYISYLYIRHIFKHVPALKKEYSIASDFKKWKNEIINFFLVSLFFAILMNVDVILAKNIFSPDVAGGYAWISILWKFLIFLMLSIETVYYGQIMEHAKNKVPMQLIRNPIFILLVVSIGAIITNYFIWGFILWTIKPELVSYYYIYMLSLVYYSSLAFISFFSKILVGWNNYTWNIILFISSLLLVLSVYIFGKNSLEAFAYCFIINGLLTSFVLLLLFLKELKIN